MKRERRCWVAMWLSDNDLDGHTEFPLGTPEGWYVWRTRRLAREWIAEHYGYIRSRPDLRVEPHGWKIPRPVRATVTVEW